MRTRRSVDYKSQRRRNAKTFPQPVPVEKTGFRGEWREQTRKTVVVEASNFNDLAWVGIQLPPRTHRYSAEGGTRGKTISSPDHRRKRSTRHPRELTISRFHANSDNRTNDPLFYSIRSGLPQMLSTDTVSVMLKHYADAARETCPEILKRVHPHLVRHTRATHLYRSGMPLSYIAEFLGHASVTTTEIYASASTEMLREALEKADPEMTQEIPSWKNEESLKKLCGL